MSFFTWSKTAASNDNTDSTINWAEGQDPATVNNSARAMMAATAKFRDDVSGSLTTGGTADAYTLTTNQSFTSLSDGLLVAFTISATNTGASTINVDSLGAKPLRGKPSTDLSAGDLVSGQIYSAMYDSGGDEWLLHNYTAVQATSANLTAISGLSTAANKMTYWTGSGAAALADLTSAGRALLDDADASAQRATLGLGSAATQATGTSGPTIPLLNANNTHSGDNTFSNSGGITAPNTVKAFCTVQNGSLQTGSFNIASLSELGTRHRITFSNAMSDTNYTVIASPHLDATNRTYVHVDNTNASYCEVYGVDAPTGSNLDPDSYTLMVLST